MKSPSRIPYMCAASRYDIGSIYGGGALDFHQDRNSKSQQVTKERRASEMSTCSIDLRPISR